MPGKVLVVGGTGMLGKPVTEQLQRDGFVVSVMSTRVSRARELLGEGLTFIEGDVTDKESLKTAIEGQEYVHINLNAHLDREKYERIEIEGTANVASIAKEKGVKRISNISSATSHGKALDPIYLSAKVRAEQAITSSGVPYSIMRPSWFFETLPMFVRDGRAAVIGDQPNPLNWLAADDYARQVSKALQSNDAANKCFYNFGPEPMTIKQALTKYCKALHPTIKPMTVSFIAAKGLSLMPGMTELKTAIPFFKFFDAQKEDGNRVEADNLLGKNATTLESWLEGQTD